MSPSRRTSANLRDAPPPSPTFSQDDLIAALSDQACVIGDGLSAQEIGDKIGRSAAWVSCRLRPLIHAGAVIPAKAPRPDIFGTLKHQPVYRMAEKRAA
jgi:hypothetical protein